MNFTESIFIAIESLRTNKLRAFLTLLSIAIGVFAIIVAISLVKSINGTIENQMEALGDNTYYIFKQPKIQMGNHNWRKYRNRKNITYSDYTDFKKQMTSAYAVGAASNPSTQTIKYGNLETNPDVQVLGTESDYFVATNLVVTEGRPFIQDDIDFNRNYAVIGNDVVQILFPSVDPIGKFITISKQKYEVIGIMETRGALLGQKQDNIVLIPISQFLKYHSEPWEESLTLMVKVKDKADIVYSSDEAIGIMRAIRNQKPWELNSFELETNESIQEQFGSITGYLSIFGMATGFIALIAAGVGIMNIMLVTIKERTREIGIRKAIGAKKKWILIQFLVETITISQIGGLIGIFAGFITSSLFSAMLGLDIIFPYDWVIIVIMICTALGVGFGLYPAMKAANLDPIEALRYE